MADQTKEPTLQEEDTNTEAFVGFSLYTYKARRPNSAELQQNDIDYNDGSAMSSTSAAEGTVADFLRKEATSDHDFSLSLLSTNLSGEQETELRTFIAKRVARGTVYSGSGNISTLDTFFSDDGALCYYCLLRGGKDNGENSSPNEDMKFLEFGDFLSKDFVVCLVSGSKSGLDLFQRELDDYCKELLPHIINFNESQDVKADFKYLESWYDDNIRFACRCAVTFKEDLAVLIQLGLSGAKLELKVQEKRLKNDIRMFVEACSTGNIPGPTGEAPEERGSLISRCTAAIPAEVVLESNGTDYNISRKVTTPFCREWAKTMLSGEVENPVFLRQVIENYKLRVNQDLNTLKRLLRQAETDHYALYRSYAFLVKCGNGPILLRNTTLEAHTLSSEDTLNIIKVLEEFIEENDKFGVDALSQ